jgi:hypothetical protein
MCSRFSLAEDHDFLAARLGVSAMALANYRPRDRPPRFGIDDVHLRWVAIQKQIYDADVDEFSHPRTALE